MHPTFVKLFIDPDPGDLLAEEEIRRRRAGRSRRARAAVAVRAASVTGICGPAVTAGHQPPRGDRQPRGTPGLRQERTGRLPERTLVCISCRVAGNDAGSGGRNTVPRVRRGFRLCAACPG